MPTPYPAKRTTPAATITTPMLVARREKRSASHVSGTANSIGSNSGSTAAHGSTAKSTNSASMKHATVHRSQVVAGVEAGSENPKISPNTIGASVTIVSTDASTHRPTSAGVKESPTARAPVDAPRRAPGSTPANSAMIQSGDTRN